MSETEESSFTGYLSSLETKAKLKQKRACPTKPSRKGGLQKTVERPYASKEWLLRLAAHFLGYCFSGLTPMLCVAVLASFLAYFAIHGLYHPLAHFSYEVSGFISRSPTLLNPLLLVGPLIQMRKSITNVYCDVLRGPGCPIPQLPVAQLARTVGVTAQQAATIFESVVSLGDPSSLGLHQTEVWELGMAVRSTSGLEGKEVLGAELMDLGDLVRDVKDRMITINSMGLNAFAFIVYEFSRIEDIVNMLHSGNRKYSSETVAQNLDLLFKRLSTDMCNLLSIIENTIPLTERASMAGGSVMESLSEQHSRLNRQQEEMPLWRKLRDGQSWQGRQLQRDLDLTSASVVNLRSVRLKLEDARSALVAYRENAGIFKASLVGWHLADHGLTAEDEIFALRHIMSEFKGTVSKAKEQGRARITGQTSSR